jgi:hypothetical protein
MNDKQDNANIWHQVQRFTASVPKKPFNLLIKLFKVNKVEKIEKSRVVLLDSPRFSGDIVEDIISMYNFESYVNLYRDNREFD